MILLFGYGNPFIKQKRARNREALKDKLATIYVSCMPLLIWSAPHKGVPRCQHIVLSSVDGTMEERVSGDILSALFLKFCISISQHDKVMC